MQISMTLYITAANTQHFLVRHYNKQVIYFIYNLTPYKQVRNQSTDKLSNLPQVTQLESSRDGI